MPWCEACRQYRAQGALKGDGGCPECGRAIGQPTPSKAPWHFKLLVGAIVSYLGWRGVQGVAWLFHHL